MALGTYLTDYVNTAKMAENGVRKVSTKDHLPALLLTLLMWLQET